MSIEVYRKSYRWMDNIEKKEEQEVDEAIKRLGKKVLHITQQTILTGIVDNMPVFRTFVLIIHEK